MSAWDEAGERRVEEYLGRVAAAMRAEKRPDAEIESVVASLREQVEDMAAHETAGSLSEHEVERFLERLDAPQTFGTASPPAGVRASPELDTARLGKLSLAVSLGSAVTAYSLPAPGPAADELGPVIFCLGQLIAFALGMAARKHIWGRAGALCSGLLFGFFLLAGTLG